MKSEWFIFHLSSVIPRNMVWHHVSRDTPYSASSTMPSAWFIIPPSSRILHLASFIPGEAVIDERPTSRWRTEPELRAAVAATLRAHGIALTEKVPCAAGEADIVTARRDLVIECKLHLTRKNLYTAVGQVLTYRQAINPTARAVIVGYAADETAGLLPHIAGLGIEIVCWRDGGWGPGAGDWGVVPGDRGLGNGEGTHDTTSIPTTTSVEAPQSPDLPIEPPIAAPLVLPPAPSPKSLHWNVAALAQMKGFTNVPALAWRMGVQRQGVYRFWNGTARQVSLDILERLSRVLEAEVGHWFVWSAGDRGLETGYQSPAPNPQSLRWNITSRMEALGLDPTRLGFRAELYSQSIMPIIEGIAQAVAIETLAKLATALNTESHPFSIGNLFTWDDAPFRERAR